MARGVGREGAVEGAGHGGPRLRVACGARAAEAALLDAVETRMAAAREDPALLARPVRIVVPSRSLREHVAAALVRRSGRALAGVRAQTLHGLAMEVLDAAGEPPLVGDPLFPVLVGRAAREAPALREVLEDLEDGYAAVAAEVADLLDAGWRPEVPAHAEALDEALAAEPSAAAERARAVAAVASRVAREMERLGCGRRGTRLARAAELLAAAPERLLPARAVLVHGFADATAVASDLIETLVRTRDAELLLDEPPDPAAPERPAPGARFTERLRERLGGLPVELPVERLAAAPPPPRVEVLRAPGGHAEVRAVAERVRDLLDAGTRPESIGVVARFLDPYRVPLRVHFPRLGIPFSGLGAAGPSVAAGRRLHALLDLLHLGPRLAAERWLELVEPLSAPRRADLRLALHGLGVGRLRDLAELDVAAATEGRELLPLAVRRGLETAEAQGDEDGQAEARGSRTWARRRTLHRERLAEAVTRAGAVRDALRGWPDAAPLAQHLGALEALVDAHLGWPARSPERRALAARVAALERELPAGEPLERDELRVLLGRALRDAGCEPLGGAGAGVQVLGVVEARARTFEHLFLLGMNRDVFPRPIVEAPLLPDDLRRRLEARLLPEIAVKRRGFEEEHYLFAQLLSASPRVVLSWQETSDDGRLRPPSPLLERLRIAREDLEEEPVRSLSARPGARARLTAAEAARLEGLHGSRKALTPLLAAALRERREGVAHPPGPPEARTLARARLAILAEQDAGPAPHPAPGPYFGFVGPVRPGADPRHRELYVTRLEDLARCPWQVFVARLLGVEPVPDALDVLPEVAGLRGTLVHRALERIVTEAWPRDEVSRDLEACAAAEPVAVPWPGPERLEALIREAAEAVLREQGLGPPALARLLALDARPFVEAARALDWPEPGAPGGIVGAEVSGAVALPDAAGRPRTLRFRADRADRAGPAGATLRLLDYKTGKTISERVREDTRARHLRGRIAAGTHLQASAYAAAGGGEGVYLFLRHSEGPGGRFSVEAGDPELDAAFRSAAATILASLDEGALFPRLTEPEGDETFPSCEWCPVRDACLQDDSGARMRLVGWMHDAERAESSPAERAARSLWWIGRARAEAGGDGRNGGNG